MVARASRTHGKNVSPAARADRKPGPAAGAALRAATENAPQQQRSVQTRSRILKSVTDLLEADAYGSATVQDIVSAAGCSVGAFYGRFKDKDAALFAIYSARCAALEEDAATILQGGRGGLKSKLGKFIERVIAHSLRYRPVMRAGLIAPAAGNISPFAQRVKEMNACLIDMMSTLLHAHADKITHRQPDRAALYVVAIIGGLTRDGLAATNRLAECNDSIDEFAKEIGKMVYGYLGLKN